MAEATNFRIIEPKFEIIRNYCMVHIFKIGYANVKQKDARANRWQSC